MPIPFRERYSLQQRKREFDVVSSRRTGYVPSIFERGSPHVPPLKTEKFMIPKDVNGAQLLYIIRRRVQLKPSQSLFLLCGGKLVSATDTMSHIYSRQTNLDDGFLYFTYTLENTFG